MLQEIQIGGVVVLLIILSLTLYHFLIAHLKTLTTTAYTQGYRDFHRELQAELSRTREELRDVRQEMQSMRDTVQEKMKATEKYRRDIGVRQDGFRMGMEDWFDLRKAELREWREEQVRVLEGLRKGERLLVQAGFLEEERAGDGVKQEVGGDVYEKRGGKRGTGWARLRAGKKEKKDGGEGKLEGN